MFKSSKRNTKNVKMSDVCTRVRARARAWVGDKVKISKGGWGVRALDALASSGPFSGACDAAVPRPWPAAHLDLKA